MDVLPDVTLAGVADEPRHGHVLAELGDDGSHEFDHRTLRVLQPGIVRLVAGLLDLGEHVLHQLHEVGRPRDEVRLAVHFGEDADGVVSRQRVCNQPFASHTSSLLRRACEAALAQNRVRLVEVAVRLGEGGLALHHSRAGLVAELLHLICRNRRHGRAPVGQDPGPAYEKTPAPKQRPA